MSSIPTDSAQYAMTVLVPEVEEAQRLAAALDEVRRPDSPLAVIAVPPVRGIAFFADAERQAKLDRWWAHAIPQDSLPVYLLVDEEGIAQWLPGLDGRFVVGASGAEAADRYRGMRNVTVAPGEGLLDIALAAVEHFAGVPMFRDDARRASKSGSAATSRRVRPGSVAPACGRPRRRSSGPRRRPTTTPSPTFHRRTDLRATRTCLRGSATKLLARNWSGLSPTPLARLQRIRSTG